MRKELIKKVSTPKTIGECYEKYRLEKKAILLKDNYGLGELQHFCSSLEYSFNDDVNLISINDVYKYTEIMNNNSYKLASINHYLSAIRTILYYFMNNGWLESFKISLVRGQQEKLNIYTSEDMNKLLVKPKENASYTEWRSWAIVSFLFATGCRASTLNAIEREDIDYKNKEVTYRHLKNKSVAVIPLSNAILKVLNDFNSIFDLSESKYLFPEVNLNKMTVGALEKSIHVYCNKRGVENKGIHAFRHTFAREWIRNNGNPMILQKLLTHSTLDMTKRYIHLFSTELHENLEFYNPLDNYKQNCRELRIKRCLNAF